MLSFECRPGSFLMSPAGAVAGPMAPLEPGLFLVGDWDFLAKVPRAPKGFAPIASVLGLTLIHLVSILPTNTSVNPALWEWPGSPVRRL